MRFLLALLLIISGCSTVPEKRIKIAILDTGVNVNAIDKSYLCTEGHKTFSGSSIRDNHGHGTNLAGIISKYVDPTQECLLIIKWFPTNSTDSTTKAFEYAVEQKVSFINFSGGGPLYLKEERLAIEKALKMGIVVVVAAGNERENLSKRCFYYPACYGFKHKNFHVVANYVNEKAARNSSYGGPVTDKENGVNVEGADIVMSGSSQATAIITGRLVRDKRRNR